MMTRGFVQAQLDKLHSVPEYFKILEDDGVALPTQEGVLLTPQGPPPVKVHQLRGPGQGRKGPRHLLLRRRRKKKRTLKHSSEVWASCRQSLTT